MYRLKNSFPNWYLYTVDRLFLKKLKHLSSKIKDFSFILNSLLRLYLIARLKTQSFTEVVVLQFLFSFVKTNLCGDCKTY